MLSEKYYELTVQDECNCKHKGARLGIEHHNEMGSTLVGVRRLADSYPCCLEGKDLAFLWPVQNFGGF